MKALNEKMEALKQIKQTNKLSTTDNYVPLVMNPFLKDDDVEYEFENIYSEYQLTQKAKMMKKNLLA